MSRIRRGWELTKKSWAVLRENRSLLRFPLYGGVAMIAMTVIVLGPGLYLIDDGEIAPGAPLVVIGLYILAFISFYFNVGLAACADRIFRGEAATVADGLAVSRSRVPQIAGWAALATTVGVLLNLLTGNIAIGGAVFLFGILPAAALVALGVFLWSSSGFAGAILVVVGVAALAIAALISQALSGIFGVALYRYALEGEAVGGFTPAEMESAVKRKQGADPAPATI